MCIMEVRPGQHDSTIAQANAHNVNTVLDDLRMWRVVLFKRAEHETGDKRLDTEAAIAEVDRAITQLAVTEAALLALFGAEVGRHLEHWVSDHAHPYSDVPVIGNERAAALASIAHQDAHRAAEYETR